MHCGNPFLRVVALVFAVLSWGTPTPAGAADDDAEEEARAHYEAGLRHYNLGEFDEAIAEFKKAYALSGAPGLLFNTAQAYRLKGDHKQALYFYRTYLRLVPEAPNRADVEARIAEMEQSIADQAARGAPPPETDPTHGTTTVTVDERPRAATVVVTDRPRAPAGRTKKLLGYAALGTGTILLASSAWLAGRAADAADELSTVSRDRGTWTADHDALYARGERDEALAITALVSGGVALAAGGVLLYLGHREVRVTGRVAVSPPSGRVSIAWAF